MSLPLLSSLLKPPINWQKRKAALSNEIFCVCFFYLQQGFFATAFGLSSGVVVTFMSLDRVVSLNSPFLYNKYATPRLARGSCLLLTMFCIVLGALPFVNVGDYVLNEITRSSCHFDWFPVDRAGTVFLFTLGSFEALLASVMTFSNIVVFIVVVRIKRRMSKLFRCDHNAGRRARQSAFRQEERMAKFVALVAVVFLLTWLPVTVISCAVPDFFCFKGFPCFELFCIKMLGEIWSFG